LYPEDIGYLKDFPSFIEEGVPPCAETDPDMFFPPEPFNGSMRIVEHYEAEVEAKSICSSCPYRIACFSYALKITDLQGIWGGTTAKERALIRSGRAVKIQKSLGLIPTKTK
jgi:WhiB family redox-sensing transcriptional regulator